MGLAIDRVPSAARLRSDLETMLATPVDRLRSFVLAWRLDGATVGHSSLKDIIWGDCGSMHLHMWHADRRGEGSWPPPFCLSVVDFFEAFNLKRVLCGP